MLGGRRRRSERGIRAGEVGGGIDLERREGRWSRGGRGRGRGRLERERKGKKSGHICIKNMKVQPFQPAKVHELHNRML
jgi:hypothetical protein